jgi:FtsZ-interacting cell division protein YlmF
MLSSWEEDFEDLPPQEEEEEYKRLKDFEEEFKNTHPEKEKDYDPEYRPWKNGDPTFEIEE